MPIQVKEFEDCNKANAWMAAYNEKFHVFKVYPVGAKLPCGYVVVYAPRISKGGYA